MKKIISIILAASMLLSLSICLFSCGGDDTDGGVVNYTVFVVDDARNPVKDVVITFTEEGGEPAMKFTKSEGVVSFESDKKVSAKITSIPDGYKKDSVNKAISFDKDGNAVVTLEKEQGGVTKETYTIIAVDQHGNPVKGVAVQMCSDSGCLGTVLTGADGQATYTVAPDDTFKVQVNDVPDGYAIPVDKIPFIDGVATVVLAKAE